MAQSINMQQLKEQELKSKVPEIKHQSIVVLYNQLQDMRHNVIVDLRPKDVAHKGQIRDSFILDEYEDKKASLLKFIYQVEAKYVEDEKKYNTKPVRRISLVGSDKHTVDEKVSTTIFECMKEYGKFDKAIAVKGGYEAFAEKYPFLCLNLDEKQHEEMKQMSPDVVNNKEILTDYQKKWFYSFSRFPTEIIEDEIYLGNYLNANNKMQLNDLKIKSLIEFAKDDDQKPAKFKEEEYGFKRIVINNETMNFVDFTEICQMIDEFLVTQEKGPVLLYCHDGENLSPMIAIAYVMWRKKATFSYASMLVFQRKFVNNPNKQLMTILTSWQPPKENVDEKKKNLMNSLFGK